MPAKPALDKKTQEELKTALMEKKVDLLQKLNQWEDNSSPSGLKEMGDIADIASQLNSEALTSVLTEVEIDTLKQIEFALEKMENGSYGICEGTKKKIPVARLKAIPWTRYTVEYAEQLSKNRPRSSFARSDSLTQFPIPMDMDNLD
ncbi:TraR/DksA family transcriptional regulator [Leptospira sp. GIMC2001]|uniref:TraR/DksA family transcriptional regulator n=1 Tax=Leptospira sp. GIMC2001 TaxID=1513297 RepID=UPI002349E813|nr:TraR/DksA family transcriptional regulator [Leptospira sp. GIMC2001]WCL47813.1 TraR/DksA family transcriptional regulator [Leptospira sp. GIMC2001]